MTALARPFARVPWPVVIAGLIVALIAVELPLAIAWASGIDAGGDLALYLDATRRWMAGGGFYPALEMAGPFDAVNAHAILYPPTALYLFVPFTVLPTILWYAPLAVLGWFVARCRPSPLALLGITALLAFPKTVPLIVAGNPSIWLAAAIALSLRYGWPAVLVLLKPTLAPLALIGVRSRSWWIALAVFAALSAVLLPMWPDYVRVLLNARHPLGVLYSVTDLPLLLIGPLAWLGRSTQNVAIDRVLV